MKNTSKMFIRGLICLIGVSVILCIWGYVLDPGDALGYSIIVFYIGYPVLSLVISGIMSHIKAYLYWVFPFISGVTCCLNSLIVFKSISIIYFALTIILGILGSISPIIIKKLKKTES